MKALAHYCVGEVTSRVQWVEITAGVGIMIHRCEWMDARAGWPALDESLIEGWPSGIREAN